MLFGQTVTLMTLQQQWSPCLPDNCFGGGGGGRGGIAHSTQVIIIKQKKYHRVSQMITALVEQTVTLFFWLYPQGNLTWDPSGRPSRKPDIVLVEKEKIILLVFKQTGSFSHSTPTRQDRCSCSKSRWMGQVITTLHCSQPWPLTCWSFTAFLTTWPLVIKSRYHCTVL